MFGSFVYNQNVNKHSLTQQLSRVISAIFYPGCPEASIYQNEQLQGQKQHFLESKLLVSPDKPKNKDAHINWQIYSPLKRELSCVELYLFFIQLIKGNNYGLIPISLHFTLY